MSISPDQIKHGFTLALAIFGVAQAIARITPTPKDDKIVSKLGKALNWLLSRTNEK
jgi:hypothetical protein